ncbi:MAG: MBL fold metallo-hydrolase [Neisseriaceae bacterium]
MKPSHTSVRLTVLGCGSSSGTPVINCDCATCTSTNPKNTRSRCSAHVQVGDQSLLIDTGPDFRQQALREQVKKIDAVLYTHPHADHLNGIDDLRAFCYKQQAAIPIYGNDFSINNIKTRFDYAFFPPGQSWDKPVLTAHTISDGFEIDGTPLLALDMPHGRWRCTAYRIGKVAWLTDINDISDEQITALQGLDYLFLDCLREESYPSHLGFGQAIAFAQRIGAKQTYLIHMTHAFSYEALSTQCPPGIDVAYDGLTVHTTLA